MKVYWESGGIAPRLISALDGGEWSAFTPRPLYPQSQSGRRDEEKNSQPLPGLESSIIQLVA
jgi:hypothetical protein